MKVKIKIKTLDKIVLQQFLDRVSKYNLSRQTHFENIIRLS